MRGITSATWQSRLRPCHCRGRADQALTNPDFVRLAETFGAGSYRVRTAAELGVSLRDAFRQRGLALNEMPVGELPNPSQYPGLGRRR